MSDKQKWEVFRQCDDAPLPDGGGWEPMAAYNWVGGEEYDYAQENYVVWRRIKPSVAAMTIKRATPLPPAKFRRVRVCAICHQTQGPACENPATCGAWAEEGNE